jgi:hypothetical protein
VGWSVPGTTSLPIVARMAGIGSPPAGAEQDGELAASTLGIERDPADGMVLVRDLDRPVLRIAGQRVTGDERRRLGRAAGRPEEWIGLEARGDPSLPELRFIRIGIDHEVPAEVIHRHGAHDHLELRAEWQEPGDHDAGASGALSDAEPVDGGGDDLAGAERRDRSGFRGRLDGRVRARRRAIVGSMGGGPGSASHGVSA